MELARYLDTTYLKLPGMQGVSEAGVKSKVVNLIQEAILFKFKLVMIRPVYVALARQLIDEVNSEVLVGTVIGFHEGTCPLASKLEEAQKAIDEGVNELDFVLNYTAFKDGNIALVTQEILKGTAIALNNNKVVKWIIEVAALSDQEIADISSLIKHLVITNFGADQVENVFVKSSTGFFVASQGQSNGATLKAIKIIHEHASPVRIKAAGGIKSKEDALKMITLGVERIGTSSAKEIVQGEGFKFDY